MNIIYNDYTDRLKEGEDWKKPLSDNEVVALIRYHKAQVRDGGMAGWVEKIARGTIQALEHYLEIKDN